MKKYKIYEIQLINDIKYLITNDKDFYFSNLYKIKNYGEQLMWKLNILMKMNWKNILNEINFYLLFF